MEPSGSLGSIQNADVAYSRDALQVPKLTGLQLAQLFHRHQPIWSVNVQSSEDRIGTVHRDAQRVFVSTEVPTVYTALSYARFNNEILVQLNYTVWFPSRPKSGPFDILGGHLDGITWRMSLDSNFQVLFADAMHNCGCYYMAFPTSILRHRTRYTAREEPLWTPKFISPDPLSRVVISIASNSHYIENVHQTTDIEIDFPVTVAKYDELRSLTVDQGGRKSMFSSDGFVEHTQRAERWLLWPMGVRSAGAMRQSGHHPIAFVGRRHFDDPHLIETYFYVSKEPERHR
ncbi:MAG: hypothetical protein VCB59_01185 [Gammaproteobacteria bacterium]